MSEKIIFLSHIHEEAELAKLLKEKIEDMFAGFVQVFVSSDRVSIPVGSNFLDRIEKGLVDCIGAIYLLSPESINRSWINFELGAVWIRNVMSKRNGGDEIPALPICHSGMKPAALPQPICNLNAIEANRHDSLEFAFQSLRRAVGGKGSYNVDYEKLAEDVSEFEHKYTFKSTLSTIFKLLGATQAQFSALENAAKLSSDEYITAKCGKVDNHVINKVKDVIESRNNKLIIPIILPQDYIFNNDNAFHSSGFCLQINREALIRVK